MGSHEVNEMWLCMKDLKHGKVLADIGMLLQTLGQAKENGRLPSHHTTTFLQPFFWDHMGEPVPEENFWCKGRLTEADTPTIRMGATSSGLSSAHLYHPPFFYRPDALPSAQPTVSEH